MVLEINSDSKLIQLLTDFIVIKWQNHKKDDNDLQDDLKANINIRDDDIVLLR